MVQTAHTPWPDRCTIMQGQGHAQRLGKMTQVACFQSYQYSILTTGRFHVDAEWGITWVLASASEKPQLAQELGAGTWQPPLLTELGLWQKGVLGLQNTFFGEIMVSGYHQENPLFAFWCFFYFFYASHEECRKSMKKHKKAKSSTCQSAFQGSQKSILLSEVF